MTTKRSISQKEKIASYLRGTGRELTAAQATRLFNVNNLSARMSELRSLGLRVYTRENYQGLTAYSISARDTSGSRKKIAFY